MTTKPDLSTDLEARLKHELGNARSSYRGEVNSCELENGTADLAWRLEAIMLHAATVEVLERIQDAFVGLRHGRAERHELVEELDERANAAVRNGLRNDTSGGHGMRNRALAAEWHRLWLDDNGRRYFNDSHRGRFEMAQFEYVDSN